MFLLFFLSFLTIANSHSFDVGWRDQFEDNYEEFHDLPLTWEFNTTVPTWIHGTFMKNGPARLHFPEATRNYTNWMDAWAKLHSFKFREGRVAYSGKMIETPHYLGNVAAGDIEPAMQLSDLEPTDWDMFDKLTILKGFMDMTAYDNPNVLPWKFGPDLYGAVTDAAFIARFDPATLDTTGVKITDHLTIMSCSHYHREPGTNNSINFQFTLGMSGYNMEVLRWRPGGNWTKPEVIATIANPPMTLIHSFSITENYAVFFFAPLYPNIMKVWGAAFHLFEIVEWHPDQPAKIAVVNLKTGDVQMMETDPFFVAHHGNAYEDGDEIIVDACPAGDQVLMNFFKLENLLNPPEEAAGIATSHPFSRYVINPKKKSVTTTEFTTQLELPKAFTSFDFPTINEKYRGKKYCYMYGWLATDYSRQHLIKKDVCTGAKDAVYSKKDHYFGELIFVTDPEGVEEDDGVLVTVAFDGVKKQSYLLMMDPKKWEIINISYLPQNMPFAFHGIYFDGV